jgi:O-antigen/teichoic acid export membrane protein
MRRKLLRNDGSVELKITTNAIGLIGCRVGADFLSLVLFVVISRHFGPVGIGEFSYGFAVATLVFVIASLGLDGYGVRQYSQVEPAGRSAWMAELLGTQLAVMAAAAVVLVGYLLLTAPTSSALAAVATLTLYQVMVALARSLFIPAIAHERMLLPAVADLLCRAVAVGGAMGAIAFSAPIGKALLGFPAAGTVLLTVASYSALRNGVNLGIRVSGTAIARICGTLWSYAAAEVVMQVYMRIGLMTLTLQIGAGATGVYAAGLKLLELACMPLIFLGVAAYPRLIRLHESNTSAFRKLSGDMLWLMVLLSGTLAWGLYFIAPEWVIPVLGAKFAGSEPVVRNMAAVGTVQAAESILWPLLLAAGLQVARLRVISISTGLNVALNLILIPRWGVNGAIAASFVSFLAIVLQFSGTLRGPLGSRILLQIFGTLFVAVAAEATVAWGLSEYGYWVQSAASLGAFLVILGASYWRSRPLPVAGGAAAIGRPSSQHVK